MNLTIKFIVAISGIILLSYGFLFFRTSELQNQLVMEQARQQARVLYRQILLTRQWVSDHNGLFLVQTPEVPENPFLADSAIRTEDGTVFVKRNPAMVTRELSEYAAKSGFCWFRITSLKPINPLNAPDDFERHALFRFEQGTQEVDRIIENEDGRVLRYMAPLTVQQSCLECHARQGYAVGDIRGGLSISVPLAWADEVVRKNNLVILRHAIFSVIGVALALVLLFNRLVACRVDRLSQAMEEYPEKKRTAADDRQLYNDEIGKLSKQFSDLCDRLEKAQEQLDQTMQQAFYNEKMAALGQLTAGIAHEINNPLGGLLNCAKSLQEEPDNPELRARYIPLLEKGLKRIEHIMRQLLNFGRKVPLTYSRIDLDQIIRECFELMEYKLKGISLELDLNLHEHYCMDVEALRQIVVNIGLNALQAMPSGGNLTVRSSHRNDRIILVIEDSGTGIAPDILDRIFDPFFTTKEVGEGTGLGLAVTYSLVKQLDGTIEVESSPGRGTSFTISLPASRDCSVPPSHNVDQTTTREH